MDREKVNPLARISEPIVRMAVVVCGYAVLLLAVAISVEIVARKLWAYSFHGIDDIGGYVLACTASIGAAYTMVVVGHTRVDIFFNMMPYRVQRALNLAAMLVFAAFSLFAAWRATSVLMESIAYKSMATNPLRTPLWQPQGVWVAGLYLLAAVSLAYAAHATWLFLKGSPLINVWYGPTGGKSEAEVTKIASIDDVQPDNAVNNSGGETNNG